jgi:hypothetical protein
MTLTLRDLVQGRTTFPQRDLVADEGYYQQKLTRRSRGGTKQKRITYVADFETTTVEVDCRVWGYGIVALPENHDTLELDAVSVGTTIDDFIDEISTHNNVVYFHNLKFDGRFILDWLLKNGYEHQTEGPAIPGCFKTMISNMGRFYSVSVKWENGSTTEFRDSYNKLPMTVKRIAESFKLDIGKGDLDYTKSRPVGYRILPEEADYIRRDVWIVARALGQQLDSGLNRLTVGSDALSEFKRLTGSKQFGFLFPVLDLDVDADIRRAYRGGFTYADPRFSGKVLGNGKDVCGLVFDVNSLYPAVMYNKAIPYGEPLFQEGLVTPTATHPLVIQGITFVAKIKPKHIPCIQIKGTGLFSETEYLSEVKEPVSMSVTNVDLELMRDHYDIRILSYDGGWKFKAAIGIFEKYIDKWMHVKATSTGGMRELAKLQLNSLYGKFATNPDVTGKDPYLDENETVRLRRGDAATRDPVYTAAGVFITSYARDLTIRAAQAQYDVFAYADTDSLHLLSATRPGNLAIHPSNLGEWKQEYAFTQAYYVRAKAYFELTESGEHHNAIAGVPLHISKELKISDLRPGVTLSVTNTATGQQVTRGFNPLSTTVSLGGKLTPKAVSGGIVLQDTPFDLKL